MMVAATTHEKTAQMGQADKFKKAETRPSPPPVKMVHRAVSMPDRKPVGRGDRGGDVFLGPAHRLGEALALGEARRDGGRQRAAGAVGAAGRDALGDDA